MADIEAIQDKLMDAAMKGVRQLRGSYHEPFSNGYCAIGWLAGGYPNVYADRHNDGLFRVHTDWPMGLTEHEADRLMYANDEARLDWLTLARKLPEILSGEWTPAKEGVNG